MLAAPALPDMSTSEDMSTETINKPIHSDRVSCGELPVDIHSIDSELTNVYNNLNFWLAFAESKGFVFNASIGTNKMLHTTWSFPD